MRRRLANVGVAEFSSAHQERWWSRRESNPRPQALRSKIYVRSHIHCSHRALPDGQGKRTASPVAIRDADPGPVCTAS